MRERDVAAWLRQQHNGINQVQSVVQSGVWGGRGMYVCLHTCVLTPHPQLTHPPLLYVYVWWLKGRMKMCVPTTASHHSTVSTRPPTSHADTFLPAELRWAVASIPAGVQASGHTSGIACQPRERADSHV